MSSFKVMVDGSRADLLWHVDRIPVPYTFDLTVAGGSKLHYYSFEIK